MKFDLSQYLNLCREKSQRVDPNLVKYYLYQLLQGVQYCHSHTVLHRDLKPSNLLIDGDGLIKISDFGLARVFQLPTRVMSKEVVTVWYRAPELLLGGDYSTPIDIWSVGCIFYEMALGRPMATGDSELDQLFRIFQLFGTPTEKSWPGCQSLENFNPNFPNLSPSKFVELEEIVGEDGLALFMKLMVYNPKDRISAKRALSHSYFDNIRAYYGKLIAK
jgi:serine/threonine protein kinase